MNELYVSLLLRGKIDTKEIAHRCKFNITSDLAD
jgi:hypothetical protein